MKRALGTCYYPEHWPRAIWREDARRMADTGLTWVRIGEFAWTMIEPEPGKYDWAWLDEAINVLGKAGLKVVLGTPTATPPRWMLKRHPDMLALDANGRPRNFGSRRHYCFSHEGYKGECARIVEALARRYGFNPYIAAWQTDNEYGCHDTAISYSKAATEGFRTWLRNQYEGEGNGGDIRALNAAWGNVFWSMSYDDFDDIDLPNLTVTEPNPSHQLAFRRFCSHQMAAFNRIQVEIIRAHSQAPITHNYMGKITSFDHFQVGADLDFASWDSYPLGFLEDRAGADEDLKQRYARQGHPDFQAFHHDLYRAVGGGRWWVMEQQPGPVNWAPYNPAPLPGMVRLWTWEAFAHGAEAVCYFRWRQAPFAQEQMHAGMLRPDSADAPAMAEAQSVAKELADAPDVLPVQAPVAIIFDYEASYGWDIQPHGLGLEYFDLVFDAYIALRALGLSIDILPPSTRDFAGYGLVLAPGMLHMPDNLKSALVNAGAEVLLGPRTASRTHQMHIPVPLPPDIETLDTTVSRVQSLRPGMTVELAAGGKIHKYIEELEGEADVGEQTTDGAPVLVQGHKISYLAGWPDHGAFKRIIRKMCDAAGIPTKHLPEGVRVRHTASEQFWFNYTTSAVAYEGMTLGPISATRSALESEPVKAEK
jgi:beta-galactosidase